MANTRFAAMAVAGYVVKGYDVLYGSHLKFKSQEGHNISPRQRLIELRNASKRPSHGQIRHSVRPESPNLLRIHPDSLYDYSQISPQ